MATIKDLEAELAALKAKHSRNWLITAVVGILIIVALVFLLLNKSSVDEGYKMDVQRLQEKFDTQKDQVEALQFANSIQDSVIKLLSKSYQNNRPTETRIIHEYEKIPNTVNSLDREQLRKQVTNY